METPELESQTSYWGTQKTNLTHIQPKPLELNLQQEILMLTRKKWEPKYGTQQAKSGTEQ